MNVDLWVPEELVANNLKKHIMSCLCDITKFIISIISENPKASLLAKIFAEQVIFTLGMVAVIVVDPDRKLKKEFQLMC